MNIINKRQYYFKPKQIKQFLMLFEEDYIPSTIIIYEKRMDLFKNLFPILLDLFTIILGKDEGHFYMRSDLICIFVFSENDDGDNNQSYQLYSLHALCHELRHRHQWANKFKLSEDEEEKDADNFATNFMKDNSKKIKKIMKWKNEWEVEECD